MAKKCIVIPRKIKPLTCKALAKKLGVSPATVSMALNDNPLVKIETRQKVKEAALKYHYRPNRIAMAMRTGRTSMIGIIVPCARFSFFPDIIDAIEAGAKQIGAQCIFCQSNGSMDHLGKEVEILLDRQVDGIILTPFDGFEDHHTYQYLLNSRIPTVFCDYELEGGMAANVASHNLKIGRLMARHLVELGHRRIVFLQGNRNIRNYRRRYQGFKRFLEESKIPLHEELICSYDHLQCKESGLDFVRDTLEGGKHIQKLLDNHISFTAVAAAGDLLAIPAMKALQARGIRVPEDVSVIGCANLDMTALISPSLTTVDQHAQKIGTTAIQLLLEKIKNPNMLNKKIYIEPSLVLRDSTAAAAH